MLAVAIDDERRQEICLTVNDPVRRRIDRKRVTKRDRPLNPIPQELIVGGGVAAGQHPDRNLRPVAVECVPEGPATRPAHHNPIAGLRLRVDQVGAIHPRVAALDSLRAARRYDDRGDHDLRRSTCCVLRAAFYVLRAAFYVLRATVCVL